MCLRMNQFLKKKFKKILLLRFSEIKRFYNYREKKNQKEMEIEYERKEEQETTIESEFFIEGWSQNSAKLELLKGQIRDPNHIKFSSSNDIIFWTKKGIGIISLTGLIEDTTPYKNFIASTSM